MATLIPNALGKRTSSDAERKLAERFRFELDHDSVLMHSVGLVRHRNKRWAEADFVLISRAGVFCIEVKGGRVARKGGVWTFTDRFGHIDEKAESPFDQAGGAAGALQAWLKENGIRRSDGSLFQVGYGVMTPDCVLDVLGPDIEPDCLLDLSWSRRTLDRYVNELGRYWQQRKGYLPLQLDEICTLRDAIRPDFETSTHPRLIADLAHEEILRFTRTQEKILRSVHDHDRIHLRGTAGTGKTTIAVVEANRLADAGQRVLFVCSSRGLAADLRTQVGDNVEVTTIAALLLRVIREAELIDLPPEADASELFETRAPMLAREALVSHPGSIFDAVILDEMQDFLRPDHLRVVSHLLIGGLHDGVWRAFEDPTQAIFGPAPEAATQLVAAGNPVRFRLDENCRNTQEIVEYVSLLSGAGRLARSHVSGPDVTRCDRWDEAIDGRVSVQAESYLDGGGRPDELIVLLHSKNAVDSLTRCRADLFTDGVKPGLVRVRTVARFKGLEARSVILAGLPTLDGEDWQRTAYVGASRALVELNVVLPSSAEASYRRRIVEYASAKAQDTRS